MNFDLQNFTEKIVKKEKNVYILSEVSNQIEQKQTNLI